MNSSSSPLPVLSEPECHDIADRVARFTRGGGSSWVFVSSEWRGTVRWARNQIHTAEETRNDEVGIGRSILGARVGYVAAVGNDISDHGLTAAVRRVERMMSLRAEAPFHDLADLSVEPVFKPQLMSESTYQLNADARAQIVEQLLQQSDAGGMLSAGYLAVSARSIAAIDSKGTSLYFPFTQARYTVTVRDPEGSGSGWAGDLSYDWGNINAARLSEIALEKCLKSRSPSRVEPGRYVAILEPQAVCDFVEGIAGGGRVDAEQNPNNPFYKTAGRSRIGDKIIDERITITADPMDPVVGFPPFFVDNNSTVDGFVVYTYRPALWIERGVLKNLSYDRHYAMAMLGKETSLLGSGAFHMSGGTTSTDEMIRTTERGLLVTRFSNIISLQDNNMLRRGFTRDGLWLIENGKITKPVKNLAFTESVLFALNNVEQLGVPQRVFHPNPLEDSPVSWYGLPQPAMVPPLKIRDFSFTALTDAV